LLIDLHPAFVIGSPFHIKDLAFPRVLQPVFLVFRNLKIIPNDMAREELDVRASALTKAPHAIISITDPDSDLLAFAPNETRLGILSLRFYGLDDISDQMSLKDAVEHIT
jgi:hypothetical protein